MIAIAGTEEGTYPDTIIEVDEYVPIKFRSYRGTLGVKYVRLGNFEDSLMEFLLDPASFAIRGFTLTSFNSVHRPRGLKELVTAVGLPMLAIDKSNFQGPIDAQRIDIHEDFSVGFGEQLLEIDFGSIAKAEKIVKSDPIEFYISKEALAGLRVMNLSAKQIAILQRQPE